MQFSAACFVTLVASVAAFSPATPFLSNHRNALKSFGRNIFEIDVYRRVVSDVHNE